jgi:hypothetical protein
VNRDEWERVSCQVRDQMAKHVWPTVTSISQTDDGSRGASWGTGNYVWLRDAPYLLTNAHVVEDAVGSHLAHLPGPTDDYVGCYNAFLADPWPIDTALMRLGDEWSRTTRAAIPASNLANRYEPAQHELLFWIGFPGSTATRHEPVTDLNRRYTWFGSPLKSPGFPMLTQAVEESVPNLPGYDPCFHVALHYPAKALQHPGEAEREVPNPKGMSGSLLWDTRFVADTKEAIEWSPDHARVCGLIWAAHTKPEIVIATRIEHVRPALLAFLQQEAAYFNWINRGRPLWDDIVDWAWAEKG